MMEIWQAMVLGFVQGATEFLPVSSSGHLRVVQHFFGLQEPQLAFDVALHAGTLLVTVLYFRKDILEILLSPIRAWRNMQAGEGPKAFVVDPGLRAAFFVLAASIPTVAIGLTLQPSLEAMAASIEFVGWMFLANSAILLGAGVVRFPVGRRRVNRGYAGMTWLDALIIGAFQGFAAAARGISRSGSTISSAMMCGVDRETAGRFSFLLSIPAIFGACVLELRDMGSLGEVSLAAVLAGVVTAIVSGGIALHLLMAFVRRGKLARFGIYTLLVGAALVLWYHGAGQWLLEFRAGLER
jgi:undecaprenyl-diphosphatase